MFAAKQNQLKSPDATALCRGVSRLLLRLQLCSFDREASTAQGRGIRLRIKGWCSDDRDVPRGKPVASFRPFVESSAHELPDSFLFPGALFLLIQLAAHRALFAIFRPRCLRRLLLTI